jgi:hypothetical protein
MWRLNDDFRKGVHGEEGLRDEGILWLARPTRLGACRPESMHLFSLCAFIFGFTTRNFSFQIKENERNHHLSFDRILNETCELKVWFSNNKLVSTKQAKKSVIFYS